VAKKVVKLSLTLYFPEPLNMAHGLDALESVDAAEKAVTIFNVAQEAQGHYMKVMGHKQQQQ
jgi:hypothetical protein